ALKADEPIELFHRPPVALGRSNVIPGREQVAGVEADVDPLLLGHPVENLAQVFETPTQHAALPGGDLQAKTSAKPRRARVHLVDSRGDSRQAPLCVRIRAWMDDELLNSKPLAAGQLLDDAADRLFQQGPIFRAEV